MAVVAVAATERYAGAELKELSFVAKDGTYVHATAYLPRSPRAGFEQQERFGTIVNLSPYYTNLYGIDTDGRLNGFKAGAVHFNETSTGMFLAHGFAYVAASVPGTGKSGGCFELGGRHEQTVMAEFIDWVGEQPWSNGNVGMTGGSYDGTTQWMAAIHQPVHLKTIVPHVSITDFYNYEYQNGAPYAWWGPYFLPNYLLLVGYGIDASVPPTANPQPQLLKDDLCPGIEDHFIEAEKTYSTGVYDDFWQARDYARDIPEIKASVFLVHGLWDWNVKPLHSDVWDQIKTEKVFWLQQMQHNAPWRDTYKAEFSRPDYNATLLAWYDHYLNGAANGIPELLPGAWVQDHSGMWRTQARWPAAENVQQSLYFGDGTLTSEMPASGTTTFVTAPSVIDPLLGMPEGVRGPDSPDQVVAKFRTEPLAAPLRISGAPHLELNVSVDRAGYSHIVAELWALHADGAWEFLGMGGQGLAQRNGRTHDDAITPLETMTVPVDLNPTESFIDKGDRLVIMLTGDDPDWFHDNGNDPTFMLEHSSRIMLPVLPANAPRGIASQEMAKLNPFFVADPKQF